jgi:trans-aconitate methyltransferase
MIQTLGIDHMTPVIDVGGGASSLPDRLVAQGFSDVSVLDLSETALKEGRRRLGTATAVTWLHEDILTWRPARRFGLWHDRAVFHFLTDDGDRSNYLATISEALEPGSGIVMATFADDGPEHCSGLRVSRYSVEALLGVLGGRVTLVDARRELHTTPGGAVQPFTWVAGVWH